MTKQRIVLGVVAAAAVGTAAYFVFSRPATPPAKVDVTGVLTDAEGRPLPGYVMTFAPDVTSAAGWPHDSVPYGLTDADGKFALRMRDPDVPGIPPGKYKVVLHHTGGRASISDDYRDPQKTDLLVDVGGTGGTQHVKLQARK